AAGAPSIIKEKHRSFTFRQNGTTARAIWFNSADEPLPAPPWDVAFTLGRNDFRGTSSPSIYVQHLRSAAEAFE
ncbi:MAG: single-stranded-DNA-specific exonuclease RecJ, partial [Verrucomicrobiota bacterium]